MIKSAFNYTGGKYRLLPQLLPLFPEHFNNFIDMFAGGGSVALNINTNNLIYINDHEPDLIELYRFFTQISIEELLNKINITIDKYNLSNSKLHGYNYYGVDSSKGLGAYNKPYYSAMREDFNSGSLKGQDRQVVFYLLTVFGFNNQIRYNRKGEFNLPVGKRDFNSIMERKLVDFHTRLQTGNYAISSQDFRDFKHVGKGDMCYFDPPYRITTASYNENGGWGLQDDLDLFRYIDSINKIGAKFALSNVVLHKGRENVELMKWASHYNMHILDFNYNNSNYQSTAKSSSTIEVLITNYDN